MPEALNEFARHLEQETRLMHEFLALLEEEAQALSDPEASQLLRVTTARKHDHAERLQACARHRATHLAAVGFANAETDLGAFVQKYPTLRPAVDQLIAAAARARAKNQENGVVIQTLQRHYQDALTALRGLHRSQTNVLYDARGRSTRSRAG